MTETAWPTLGPQVCDWIESNLPFGPGVLEGQPARLRLDQQALIWAAYEVYPQGHERAGRRRYSEVFDSEPKGCAKTELAGWIGGAELDGPVRCDGFDANGAPVGVAVHAPDIPFLATTMAQAQDLAFTRARYMLENGALADRIDAGEEKIYLPDRGGKLYVVTAKAKSSDGYIPTFAHGDETHLFMTAELLKLFDTVWRNLNKRPDADPWGLQTTTAYLPGEGSVAELTHELARSITAGEVDDTGLLFLHRQADEKKLDIKSEESLRTGILEAYGPAARELADVEKILRHFRDPRKKLADNLRYWLNLIVKGAYAWLTPDQVKAAKRAGEQIARRTQIALGFDGSLYDDATALIGCRLHDGHLFVIGIWQRPEGKAGQGWAVPKSQVDQALRRAMREYDVARAYCDKHWWQDYIDVWHADFGDVVVEWDTRRETPMSHAVERLETAFADATVTIDAHPLLAEHLENARIRPVGSLALRKDGRPPVVLRKENEKSPLKIDAAVASVLAYEARADAIASGALKKRRAFKLHAY